MTKAKVIGLWMIALILWLTASVSAADILQNIPPELARWAPWVLHGMQDRQCPNPYNDPNTFQCIWPSQLELQVESEGGRFTQGWSVFADAWVALPGGDGLRPVKVGLDGRPAVVVDRNGAPHVRMSSGKHQVEGAFEWSRIPEMIRIPSDTGLIRLTISGQNQAFPIREPDGRLWLQKAASVQAAEDRMEIRIHRLIKDDIPMTVTQHLRIDVSGSAREVELDGILLDGMQPLALTSPIPARIAADGRLKLQVRPGRWEIWLVGRFWNPVSEIGPVHPLYGEEIWAFEAQNHLRMVKILGLLPVDPNRTETPQAWKNFPTYVVKAGSRMQFQEIRRGDPDPAPDQLNLQRAWWLDFDGRGLTVQDTITGTLSRQWYLAMDAPAELGRVSVDGQDQLITAYGPDEKPGVELRRGRLNLIAESRCPALMRNLPAVGWDHDFQSVDGVLHLPPGWRLLTASGVDVMPGTWFERWTLLDFFLVLIIALAVLKLNGWRWAIVALIVLTLIFHEPGAPRLVWLHILCATALLGLLPDGRVRQLIRFWRIGALIALVVMVIPFMIQQVRWGIYPQLEPVSPQADYPAYRGGVVSEQADTVMPGVSRLAKEMRSSAPEQALDQETQRKSLELKGQDPGALIQTGPGLPDWRWRQISMKWNGPVQSNHKIALYLLSPLVNLILAFLRVILLAVFIAAFVDLKSWARWVKPGIAAAACIGLLLSGVSDLRAEDFPSESLLKELQNRLLEKPDCFPYCADCAWMQIQIIDDAMMVRMSVDAAVDTAIPLPIGLESWHPESVSVNTEFRPLRRDVDGLVWTLAPAGVHVLTLSGRTPPYDAFHIPLPLRPHRVTMEAPDWEVQGIESDGRVGAGIQLVRKRTEATPAETYESHIPPFFHVTRILKLGLVWQVHTRVERRSPQGTPAVIAIPLLDTEAVTTPGIRVEDSRAVIAMPASGREIFWDSNLEITPRIFLQAPIQSFWNETWILDASPIWHCEFSGIAVIHHQDVNGHWRPEWKPWSGESVAIEVTRPKAVSGNIQTIDRVDLALTPGQRSTAGDLTLGIRASQGGEHRLQIPENASLLSAEINGRIQNIRQKGAEVVIPIVPGAQKVHLKWRQDEQPGCSFKGPAVDIAQTAVNSNTTFHMPRDRWILWVHGPRMGPAVLFWSYVFVIALAALGLGRVSWTPLNTGHWFLLGLGLTQVPPPAAVIVAGWFLVLGVRRRSHADHWLSFNLSQLVLIAWTLAALSGLYLAIERGLLGIPDMQIAGNQSSDFYLHWTQDRTGTELPRPWVLSLPLLVYHLLMLAWALWLAASLLKWFRWAWGCFAEGGIWKKRPRLVKPENQATEPSRNAGAGE